MKRIGGTIHIPPVMLGEMGRWIISNYSIEAIHELDQVSEEKKNSEWEKIRREWERKNTLSLRSYESIGWFDIDLKGWRYLPKVDVNEINIYYPKGIKISFSTESEISGTWDDDGHIELSNNYREYLKFKNYISHGLFQRASNLFMNMVKSVMRVFYHEVTHMAQAILSVGVSGRIQGFVEKRIPAPGLPSSRIMTPSITQDSLKQRSLDDSEKHSLDDFEFYTRLKDEIYDFKVAYKKSSPQQKKEAVAQWVGAKSLVKSQKTSPFVNASKWFLVLKKHAPGKWKKAILEFTKAVL